MANSGARHSPDHVGVDQGLSTAFVLDRASILDRLGGDEDIYSVMVDMFLEDVQANCRALAKAVASGDASALSREAHTVKGLLAMFSDASGAAHAFWLERQAKAGQVAGLGEAVASLQRRLHEVAAALR
jgi:histidine phosphotransfer protein HptB